MLVARGRGAAETAGKFEPRRRAGGSVVDVCEALRSAGCLFPPFFFADTLLYTTEFEKVSEEKPYNPLLHTHFDASATDNF